MIQNHIILLHALKAIDHMVVLSEWSLPLILKGLIAISTSLA